MKSSLFTNFTNFTIPSLVLSLFSFSYSSHAVNVNPTELTASVLIQEAGGEKDPRAMAAVLEVIQNRAMIKYGNSNINSYSNIVTKRHQFECITRYGVEGIIFRAKRHAKYNEALKLVKENKISNYTFHSTHFYNPSIPAPSWAKYDEFRVKIGNHYFYEVDSKVVRKVGKKK